MNDITRLKGYFPRWKGEDPAKYVLENKKKVDEDKAAANQLRVQNFIRRMNTDKDFQREFELRAHEVKDEAGKFIF